VLGCTHYPLLKPLLQSEAPHLALVDSALTTAEATAAALAEASLLNPSQTPADYHFYVSDIPLRFQTIGERFLGRSLEQIEMMRLG
jgi:glutamate racemase